MAITATVEGWELNYIHISRDQWTEGKPFKGKMSFQNKQGEEVAFNIPQDKMPEIIRLLCDSNMDAAKRMGVDIQRVLPQVLVITALPPAKEESQPAAAIVEDELPL